MNSIGLAVSDHHVVLVKLKKKLAGDPFLEHYRIVSLGGVSPEDREEIILSNIEGFIDEHRGDRDNFFISIPGSKVIFKRLSLPSPTEENLAEVLGFEMDRYTPFTLEEVYFDFKIIERDTARNLIQVLLLVARKEVVDYYLTLLQRIRIKVRGIEVTSTALANVLARGVESGGNGTGGKWLKRSSEWLYARGWLQRFGKRWGLFVREEEVEEGRQERCVQYVVAINGESCEMGLVKEGRLLYARSFTVAGEGGSGGTDEEVRARVGQIVSELATTQLTVAETHFGDVSLYVAGGGADQRLITWLREQEQIDARMLEDPGIPVSQPDAREQIPALSAAIGTALKGLRKVPLDVNLIPKVLRPKKKKNWNLILGMSAMVFLLLLLSSFTVTFFVKERMYLAGLTERVNALKGGVQEVEVMQKEISAIQEQIDALESIKAEDVSKLKILKELTEIIPEDMWLTQLSYSERKGKREIDLSGFATTASELIPLLEESKLFEDVKFKASIVKDKGSDKEKFNVSAIVSSQ